MNDSTRDDVANKDNLCIFKSALRSGKVWPGLETKSVFHSLLLRHLMGGTDCSLSVVVVVAVVVGVWSLPISQLVVQLRCLVLWC